MRQARRPIQTTLVLVRFPGPRPGGGRLGITRGERDFDPAFAQDCIDKLVEFSVEHAQPLSGYNLC